MSCQQEVDAGKTGKRVKKKGKFVPYKSKLYSVAIKCYEEQLPYGFEYTATQVQGLNPEDFQALMIRHDRDLVSDGIWQVSTEKWHIHLIIRTSDKKKRFRLNKMMERLGIVYRPGKDDLLWENHGVETVGNFSGYATYLTHETPDAIRDGKQLYDISEIISNLTLNEIKQVRDGYYRATVGPHIVTAEELAEMDAQAYSLGYGLGDFDSWYGSQPFHVRASAKMRTIRESYFRGVEVRVRERTAVNRLCVYIQGEPNTGKTYAATKALAGKQVLTIGGGGTGKFDYLRPDHDAIVIDDDIAPNLLNMTDNYICRAYRRNNNNPVWAGEYFIVTSNLSFESWLRKCGIKTKAIFEGDETVHYKAMLSRFFVCRLKFENGVNRLALTSPSTRGSRKEQIERLKKYLDFRDKFDETMKGYKPGMNEVDYSGVIEQIEQEGTGLPF